MAESSEKTVVAKRYLDLSPKRDRYLERGRLCSELTIPSLLPPEGTEEGTDLPAPAQGDGAQGVNSLSAQILLAELPPNLPVFRLETTDVVASIMESQDPAAAKIARETRKTLDKIPREALKLTETYAHRPAVAEGIRHLIVAGNILFWFMPDGKIRAIPLSRYVVLRDAQGFVLEVIIKDTLSAMNLPPNLAAIVKDKTTTEVLNEAATEKSDAPHSPYPLYNYVCWNPKKKKYDFWQEFEGVEVDGSRGLYTKEDMPLIPLCFTRADGEDYGRSYVEEFRGILMSIEAISQSEATLSIAMSELKWLVSAASGVRARDLQNAPQGAYLDGEPDSVGAVVAGKYGDLAAIAASKEKLQKSFGLAFMVPSAIQRSGERVTAEEIRTLVQMIERNLGGLYSTLSVDFQVPYVRFQLRLLKKAQGFDILKNTAVKWRIITGLEALGQSAEAQQFLEAQKIVSELVGPQAYGERVNIGALSDKIMSYWGVEASGIFRSDEEIAQAQAEAAQQEENKAAVGPIINAASKALTS